MRPLLLALLALLLAAPPLPAAEPSGEEIARLVIDRPRAAQASRAVLLVLFDGRQGRRERRIRSFWKLSPRLMLGMRWAAPRVGRYRNWSSGREESKGSRARKAWCFSSGGVRANISVQRASVSFCPLSISIPKSIFKKVYPFSTLSFMREA